jgi:5-methylcytosine-specific restriction endonuclease McrA
MTTPAYIVSWRKVKATAARYRARHPDRIKETKRSYSENNREKIKSYQKLYCELHKDVRREKRRAWSKANPEKQKALDVASRARRRKELVARTTKWVKNNPEKAAAICANKRARKKNAEGQHSAADTIRIRRLQRDRCAYCRMILRGRGQLDHIVSLARGGSNWPANLQWLCSSCNAKKHARDPIEFCSSMGRLI